ncbi:MAG: hypothetical protein AAB893_03380 [Patescibacteria group bacterium]
MRKKITAAATSAVKVKTRFFILLIHFIRKVLLSLEMAYQIGIIPKKL